MCSQDGLDSSPTRSFSSQCPNWEFATAVYYSIQNNIVIRGHHKDFMGRVGKYVIESNISRIGIIT